MSHKQMNHISPFVEDAIQIYLRKHPEAKKWPYYKIRQAQEIEELREGQVEPQPFAMAPNYFHHG